MLTNMKYKLSLCFKYRLFAHFVNICAYKFRSYDFVFKYTTV